MGMITPWTDKRSSSPDADKPMVSLVEKIFAKRPHLLTCQTEIEDTLIVEIVKDTTVYFVWHFEGWDASSFIIFSGFILMFLLVTTSTPRAIGILTRFDSSS